MDAATDYAQHIPMRVIADMLGFPPEDGSQFREFVEDLIEGINLPPDERIERVSRMWEYLLAQVHEHSRPPARGPHELSHQRGAVRPQARTVPRGRRDGPAAHRRDRHVLERDRRLAVASGEDPADRRRLVAEPGLLPTAIEEFLRAYAPVTMARLVKEDMHWHGVDMTADDWILLSFPAANRDPTQFDRADEVVIDREVNRHAAFGLGIHRCLGSHLARMELRVALEVWLEADPRVQPGRPVGRGVGRLRDRGPRALPLRIR